jgi:hypothetical protein
MITKWQLDTMKAVEPRDECMRVTLDVGIGPTGCILRSEIKGSRLGLGGSTPLGVHGRPMARSL